MQTANSTFLASYDEPCIAAAIGHNDRNRWVRVAVSILTLIAMATVAAVHWSSLPEQVSHGILAVGGFALATLASEDLTCIAAGELVRHGAVGWPAAMAGCLTGIYLGDLSLWFVGRLATRKTSVGRWVTARVTPARLALLGDWFDRRTPAAILFARFIPGMRLPLFLAAGAAGRGGLRFACWSLLAALLWTPLLVGGVVLLGDSIAGPAKAAFGSGWIALPGSMLAAGLLVRAASRLSDARRADRMIARVSRIWRWEFWPSWLFYAPVAVWITLKSLRRGGLQGFARITAANPGIPDGGFVGESKLQILAALPPSSVIPFIHVPSGLTADRLELISSRTGISPTADALVPVRQETSSVGGWKFPLIFKPDVGQRGAGVRLAKSEKDVETYLAQHPEDILVQPFHVGPYEVGVFYYRLPGEEKGCIFSITEKVFPEVVGDGVSTFEQLVWSHPRYRMQAARFLTRHSTRATEVIPAGEQVRLAVAGNHCQGTLFKNGRRYWTAELEQSIDGIAQQFRGFYFGRFDIRFGNENAFRAGHDIAIIELNGVTSESTDIYDPAGSLWQAWATLIRQWNLLYEIADRNIAAGHHAMHWRDLWSRIRDHLRHPAIDQSAD